jgi:hypothetical protein
MNHIVQPAPAQETYVIDAAWRGVGGPAGCGWAPPCVGISCCLSLGSRLGGPNASCAPPTSQAPSAARNHLNQYLTPKTIAGGGLRSLASNVQ